jgi:hypothetical protein
MLRRQDPKPEILRIEELVQRVKAGDIKLPKFQRIFVWNRTDILNLCDSVYKGYPIGSILLWFTNEKLASEHKIGDLEINQRAEEYPVNYLLDGQQRLSTLCGALYWNGTDINSTWNICFDLEKEQFFYPKTYQEVWHFPMNKLSGTFDFINQCRRFESHPNKDKYEENAQRLLQTIKDYKIATVTIKDMSLNEVAPIFERINSTGRALTIVDLMRAATWSGSFDLNDGMNAVRKSLEPKKFDDVSDGEILKNISARSGFGILKDDIDKLRELDSLQLQESVKKCINSYKLAVDFLTSELPLASNAYVPYNLQLTLLVEFFGICRNPTLNQRNVLKRWFWHTSFSSYFRSSNYSLVRGALNQIRKFAEGEIQFLEIDQPINYKAIFSEPFTLKKASSKTFALLLASNKPKSLLDGSSIDIYKALAVTNKYEYHHIFPINFLKRLNEPSERINMHTNICMLSLDNNRKISDSKPSEYFRPLKTSLGSELDEVLASNFISTEAYEACLNDDYNKFIELRLELLINTLKNLVGKSVEPL